MEGREEKEHSSVQYMARWDLLTPLRQVKNWVTCLSPCKLGPKPGIIFSKLQTWLFCCLFYISYRNRYLDSTSIPQPASPLSFHSSIDTFVYIALRLKAWVASWVLSFPQRCAANLIASKPCSFSFQVRISYISPLVLLPPFLFSTTSRLPLGTCLPPSATSP